MENQGKREGEWKGKGKWPWETWWKSPLSYPTWGLWTTSCLCEWREDLDLMFPPLLKALCRRSTSKACSYWIKQSRSLWSLESSLVIRVDGGRCRCSRSQEASSRCQGSQGTASKELQWKEDCLAEAGKTVSASKQRISDLRYRRCRWTAWSLQNRSWRNSSICNIHTHKWQEDNQKIQDLQASQERQTRSRE